MANNVYYVLRAVSKDKTVLERLLSIMKYEDPEYFMYRVFSAVSKEGVTEKDGYHSIDIFGDMAWTVGYWFAEDEDEKRLIVNGYEKDENGQEDYSRPIYGTSHYIGLRGLCSKLGFGVEVWSEDINGGVQEHVICDRNENGMADERFFDSWTKDDLDDLTPEQKKEYGISDDYVPNEGYGNDWGTFVPDAEIFNQKK